MSPTLLLIPFSMLMHHSWKEHVVVQVVESVLFAWKTWLEFQASSFGFIYYGHLENKTADGRFLSMSHCLSNKM